MIIRCKTKIYIYIYMRIQENVPVILLIIVDNYCYGHNYH